MVGSSPRPPVADKRGERSVIRALRDHFEREFVDHFGGEGLKTLDGPPRFDAVLAGRLTRLCACGLEALGGEAEIDMWQVVSAIGVVPVDEAGCAV
jgi:hypothetical protein